MSALSPTTFAEVLPALRAVTADAERRAAELREFVTLLEAEDVANIDPHIGDQHSGGQFVKDILERVDATSHIHSGSSDASRVRMLTSALFALLTARQREDARGA